VAFGVGAGFNDCNQSLPVDDQHHCGFISKDIENRNRVFINGLLYTLGRAISYTAIALIIYFGADQFKFSVFF